MPQPPSPPDPAHGVLGCTSRRRYRCIVCWGVVCWCKGAADQVELELGALLSQELFRDRRRITDVGLCDDCWDGLGGGALHAQGE